MTDNNNDCYHTVREKSARWGTWVDIQKERNEGNFTISYQYNK